MASLRCRIDTGDYAAWGGAWGLSRLRLRLQDVGNVGSVALDFEGVRSQNHGLMKCNTQVKQPNTMCTCKDATSSPLKSVYTDCRDLFRMPPPSVQAQRYDFTQGGTT